MLTIRIILTILILTILYHTNYTNYAKLIIIIISSSSRKLTIHGGLLAPRGRGEARWADLS